MPEQCLDKDLMEDEDLMEGRSEGFPERDIWFLGTLDQGSARCPEFFRNRRRGDRHRRPPAGARPAGAQRPLTPRKDFL